MFYVITLQRLWAPVGNVEIRLEREVLTEMLTTGQHCSIGSQATHNWALSDVQHQGIDINKAWQHAPVSWVPYSCFAPVYFLRWAYSIGYSLGEHLSLVPGVVGAGHIYAVRRHKHDCMLLLTVLLCLQVWSVVPLDLTLGPSQSSRWLSRLDWQYPLPLMFFCAWAPACGHPQLLPKELTQFRC